MADPQQVLSQQDRDDLAAIRKQLPDGDARASKIDTLLAQNPAPTQPGNAFTSPQGFLPTVRANLTDALRPSNDSDGGLVSRTMHDFGRGAAATLAAPLVHPMDAAAGVASTVLHPIDTAKALVNNTVQDFKTNGAAKALPNLVGQAAGTVIGGELTAPAIAGASRAVNTLAPSVAEGALNITKIDRGFGKTPGQAVIDLTKGVRPDTVADSARAALKPRNAAVDDMARMYPNPVDITPAVDSVEGDINTAKLRNNVSGSNALQPVRAQLTENPFNLPQPFASPATPPHLLDPMQTAEQALNLKRGLRDQFVKNWNPDAASVLTRDSARVASGTLDTQLDNALGPQFAKTNQEISSLIPVAESADSISRGAPMMQRIIGRARAHTGALAAGLAGAGEGYAHGGLPGALIGGAAGVAIPEMVGGPTATMILARGLGSKIPAMVARPTATGLFLPKPNLFMGAGQ